MQILARNEQVNVTGEINTKLYKGLLDDNQIAKIRCLVKGSVIAGTTMVHTYGGYPSGKSKAIKLNSPQKTIVVDQPGFQWQDDFRNTGGMFFYPDYSKSSDLPKQFTDWQNEIYLSMFGYHRPDKPSNNTLKVRWNGVGGVVDLDQVALGIAKEFRQALDAVVEQGSLELKTEEKINFKFLKAGMGFFAAGLGSPTPKALEQARLRGILYALKSIDALEHNDKKKALGKIGRLELPFSEVPNTFDELKEIETIAEKLGLEWGGAGVSDAYKPVDGYVNATTNCADPHAMIGNEGSHHSVDAALSTNADLSYFNPAYNDSIQLNKSTDYTISKKDRIMITKEYQDLRNAIKALNDAGDSLGTENHYGSIASDLAENMERKLNAFMDAGKISTHDFQKFANEFKQLSKEVRIDSNGEKSTYDKEFSKHRHVMSFSALLKNIGIAPIPFVGLPIILGYGVITKATQGEFKFLFNETRRQKRLTEIDDMANKFSELEIELGRSNKPK